MSSLGQRCTVYVHLNSIHSVWGWKFIIWFWLLYCTVDWYQLVQFKFTALKLQNHITMAQMTTKTVWVCKWSTANKDDKKYGMKIKMKAWNIASKQEKRICLLQFVFMNCLSCSILLAIPFWPTCGSLRASTSLLQVGTPAFCTLSTLCSYPDSISVRNSGECIWNNSWWTAKI